MKNTKHNLMKTTPLMALLALALLAVTPLSVAADQRVTQEEALQVLERTEEYIADVFALVQETDSDQARMILGSANRKQTQARNMYDTERYPLAVRMSNQAREICNQADRLVRGSVGSGERARQLLDRLHDLHERVSDRAQETNNSQAMVFVRQSENLYQRARQQFDQTRYERSLHLLQQAETALKRAARMVLEAGDGERLRNDIERISQLIESATERLGDQSDPAILRSLERASRTLDDARLALDSDQPLRAMRLTQRARKDVERVLRQSRAGLSAAAVQREIDRFDERMIRLRDEVSDGAAIRQLNQAGRLRDDSEQALIKGEKEVALRTIRSALNLQRLAGETTR